MRMPYRILSFHWLERVKIEDGGYEKCLGVLVRLIWILLCLDKISLLLP